MLRRLDSARAFLDAARELLEREEAAHSLMLGIAQHIAEHGRDTPVPPYFAVGEEHGQPAFAALMTPPYKLQLSQTEHAPSGVLDALLDDLLTEDWSVPGVMGPPAVAAEFATRWSEATGTHLRPGMDLRIHQLLRVTSIAEAPGMLRPAEERDMGLLVEWALAFLAEAVPDYPEDRAKVEEDVRGRVAQGRLYVWDDGGSVSMAERKRPTRHGMSIGRVYTPPEHRRRGYATSCVAKLSQHILDSGKRFCCLFTDLSNPISNSIYARIGYRPVCDVKEYHFE